jgi:hypothetical protein
MLTISAGPTGVHPELMDRVIDAALSQVQVSR